MYTSYSTKVSCSCQKSLRILLLRRERKHFSFSSCWGWTSLQPSPSHAIHCLMSGCITQLCLCCWDMAHCQPCTCCLPPCKAGRSRPYYWLRVGLINTLIVVFVFMWKSGNKTFLVMVIQLQEKFLWLGMSFYLCKIFFLSVWKLKDKQMEEVCLQTHTQLVFSIEVFEGIGS